MLLCFIIYQYYFLGDLLMEILISTTKEIENSASNETQNILLENQNSNEEDLEHILFASENMAIEVKELIRIRDNYDMKSSEKTRYISNLP